MTIKPIFWIATVAAIAISAVSLHAINKNTHPESAGRNTSINSNVEIQIGEMPQTLIDRYGDHVVSQTKNHAVYGMSWYRIRWPNFDGELSIIDGDQSLQLNNVGAVQGIYDSRDFPADGIYEYSISMGLPTSSPSPEGTMPHQEARTSFYGLLRRIRQAGWIRHVPAYAPRLSGAETFRYQMNGMDSTADMYPLDELEMPSFQQWIKLGDGSSWDFYKSGVYMKVRVYRDSHQMNPDKPGAYYISIGMTSRDEYQRKKFEGNDRTRWKILYPRFRQDELGERAKIEAKLGSMGYTIDTGYTDPDQ